MNREPKSRKTGRFQSTHEAQTTLAFIERCRSRFIAGRPAKIQSRRRFFALHRWTGFAVHRWIAIAEANKINEANPAGRPYQGPKLVHPSSAKKSTDSARVQQ
jgi:hypothetical protein